MFKEQFMFGAFKRAMQEQAPEEVRVLVVDKRRSVDGSQFTLYFQEVLGERQFTQTFEWYGPNGASAPKPAVGSIAMVHVDAGGEVVYAGHASQ